MLLICSSFHHHSLIHKAYKPWVKLLSILLLLSAFSIVLWKAHNCISKWIFHNTMRSIGSNSESSAGSNSHRPFPFFFLGSPKKPNKGHAAYLYFNNAAGCSPQLTGVFCIQSPYKSIWREKFPIIYFFQWSYWYLNLWLYVY